MVDTFYNIQQPIGIDHGTYEGAFKALEAGFTSIMFDGSHYPFEENLAKTKVVAKCHSVDVSVRSRFIGGRRWCCWSGKSLIRRMPLNR